jgi:hypothetical protein
LAGSSRPIPAGRDWPLYGDEYGRMKFGNVQKPTVQIYSIDVIHFLKNILSSSVPTTRSIPVSLSMSSDDSTNMQPGGEQNIFAVASLTNWFT